MTPLIPIFCEYNIWYTQVTVSFTKQDTISFRSTHKQSYLEFYSVMIQLSLDSTSRFFRSFPVFLPFDKAQMSEKMFICSYLLDPPVNKVLLLPLQTMIEVLVHVVYLDLQVVLSAISSTPASQIVGTKDNIDHNPSSKTAQSSFHGTKYQLKNAVEKLQYSFDEYKLLSWASHHAATND